MQKFTLAAAMVISLGWLSSPAQAILISQLLPAIQKVRDTSSRTVQVGFAVDPDSNIGPVLMVLSDEDFIFAEYDVPQVIGRGPDAKLVMSGWALVGRFGHPRQTRICRTVATFLWNPENPETLMLRIETGDAAGRPTTVNDYYFPSESPIIVLEYLILG